jgi:hypothetical protein
MCVVSLNVLHLRAPLRWAVRERPVDQADNGWRFFSIADTEEYLADPANLTVAPFNQVAAIEPAIIMIYPMPVGTDLVLVREQDGRMYFVDNRTLEPIQPPGPR